MNLADVECEIVMKNRGGLLFGIAFEQPLRSSTLPRSSCLARSAPSGVVRHPRRAQAAARGLPETRIVALFLSTFHTFPEVNTIVKSQTLIERQA
jgi:hypothetical protein